MKKPKKSLCVEYRILHHGCNYLNHTVKEHMGEAPKRINNRWICLFFVFFETRVGEVKFTQMFHGNELPQVILLFKQH